MRIKLIGIEGIGDINRERIVLKALRETDIGDYAILLSKRSEEGIPTGGSIESAFWFPNRDLKPGDLVILYTKSGKRGQKSIGEEKTSHFYYWDWGRPIWTTKTIPVLLHAAEWEYPEEDDSTLEPGLPKSA
jgi:hypothetical protein